VIGVTGTNGKTSCTQLLGQALRLAGHSCGVIGTLGCSLDGSISSGSLTTPDPIVLHETLDRLAGAGITHLALEASSHGLVQHRLDGLRLSVAGFTNLTRDHLDYHGSLEAYRAAKLVLFEKLLPADGTAVVCADGAGADAFLAAIRRRGLRCLTVGRKGVDLTLTEAVPDGFGQRLAVEAGGRRFTVRLGLPGGFQADNVLVAAGLAIATGGETAAVMAALDSLRGAPGRLEKVAEANGALVVVDYAHTPDALANALTALRPYARGRLVAVFGAGGDRDAGKRPLMGAVAAKRANLVYVTDDNPRSEYAADIRKQILEATPRGIEIGDREEAIKAAVKEMKDGDVLLVAGKGHETGQIVGERILPFSDQAAVRAALGIRP
jgi:UDP-N-acetylmuramoyl-L-alanyl-D-glutamate--2,6-diaminopimelate ligase